MRIQHNIMAMNAYRNYNNNTAALAKNLEKLSSGYKINRAGDDAAGLAISEKMRAQITGLSAARKNVKDGISLVKTAEGAMQEIQDMLNRMDYLATQSANGTYDDPVDRKNLQKEVDALKTEINRIADSANFNGIQLLDGSLAGKTSTTKGAGTGYYDVSNVNSLLGSVANTGTKGQFITAAFSNASALDGAGDPVASTAVNGDTVTVKFDLTGTDGTRQTVEVKLTVTGDENAPATKLVDENGNETTLATQGSLAGTDISKAVADALKKNDFVKNNFKVTDNAGQITFDAKENSAAAAVNGVTMTSNLAQAAHTETKYNLGDLDTNTKGTDSFKYLDFDGKDLAWDGDATKLDEKIMTVDGKKFLFIDASKVSSASTPGNAGNNPVAGIPNFDYAIKLAKEAGVDIGNIVFTDSNTLSAKDVANMAMTIADKTGLQVERGDVVNGGWVSNVGGDMKMVIKTGGSTTSSTSGGLRLQIGDTADSFNQMNVLVGDMHTKALGIDGIDISNQEGAAAAIKTIKAAINNVSEVRGDLGAIQNRLDHTANNLSVMQENIQDAESTIRDTDVAEEMMAYTKNNILIQSAQAMLAQANAVPQGVLQLLG